MSIQHHSPEDAENEKRLIDEIFRTAERKWPHGRISGDDDGVTAYAIASDPEHKIVRIQFTKPMLWLGLDIKAARKLRDAIDDKLSELCNCKQV
jgi:hypothetical protein